MAFASLINPRKKRDSIIAISFGSRTTKAVEICRRREALCLRNYLVVDAPIYEQEISVELLADHLKSIVELLETDTRRAVFVLSARDSLLRLAEMPPAPASDLRKVLKHSSKIYLQEELTGHVFDCHVVREATVVPAALRRAKDQTKIVDFGDGRVVVATPDSERTGPQSKVLVGAVKVQTMAVLRKAAKDAGLSVEQITVPQVGQANALLATPDFAPQEAVALVDFGFSTSTIGILSDGKLMHGRVVPLGGDTITKGLADAMNIPYPAAENLKTVLPEKVEARLEDLLTPLIEELRASIDFFEDHAGKRVTEVSVFGASARSAVILQALQKQLVLPCKNWVPTGLLTLQLPPEGMANVERDASVLVAAIGAAMAWFNPQLPQIDFLAEEREAAAVRRSDPLRKGFAVAAALVALMLLWAGQLAFAVVQARAEVRRHLIDLQSLQRASLETTAKAQRAGKIEQVLAALQQQMTNRFLFANTLDALQRIGVDNIQVVRMRIEQNLNHVEAPRPGGGKPLMVTKETITVTIQAKDHGVNPTIDAYIEAITANNYFQSKLREVDPILLKERSAPIIDPEDPTRSFVLFTIECVYAERTL
jgi:Tfp pilus assembly PilM family ATPase